MQEPGKAGDAEAAMPEGWIRGDPNIGQPVEPEGTSAREIWGSADWRRRRSEGSGRPGDSPSVQPEGAGIGATRGCTGRHSAGRSFWGNPKHRGDERQRMREARRLADRLPATAREDAGGRVPCGSIRRLTGDEDSVRSKDTRKAPGMRVSGAFVLGRLFPLQTGRQGGSV